MSQSDVHEAVDNFHLIVDVGEGHHGSVVGDAIATRVSDVAATLFGMWVEWEEVLKGMFNVHEMIMKFKWILFL